SQSCKAECPGVPHRYCLRHIVANINTAQGRHLSSTEEGLAFKLARSDSHETFARHMEKLRALNPDAADFLLTIPFEHWVTYAFPRSTFGNVTSNMSESASQWLGTELRSSDAVMLHFRYMLHLLKNINERRYSAYHKLHMF
ncbi:hypothetical protein AaE_013584, partial [Aphanomyces astaci]